MRPLLISFCILLSLFSRPSMGNDPACGKFQRLLWGLEYPGRLEAATLKLRQEHPDISRLILDTNPENRTIAYDNEWRLYAVTPRGMIKVGRIAFDITNGVYRAQEDSEYGFRNLGVNQLLQREILEAHPEIQKIESVPIQTNLSGLLANFKTGKTGDALKSEIEGMNLGAKRTAEASLLKAFATADTPSKRTDLRRRLIAACLEGMPSGRNRVSLGFGHIHRIHIKKLSDGGLSIEIQFEKAERRDDQTVVLYEDVRLHQLKQIKSDGTVEDMPMKLF